MLLSGPYMLFAMDANGSPSIAATVIVGVSQGDRHTPADQVAQSTTTLLARISTVFELGFRLAEVEAAAMQVDP